MFDPFDDFDDKGYLQNALGLKDPADIKEAEHAQFLAQLTEAVEFLAGLEEITFEDFLKTHAILFGAFYPTWAGKSRASVLPDKNIDKGDTIFCHPRMVQSAVEYGLQIASSSKFKQHAGKAMGQFAFGHPFLDGNGRTMLLIHAELCYRAGFSIDWTRTNKAEYLRALTNEIAKPQEGHLDKYLAPFISEERIELARWQEVVMSMPGLDSVDEEPGEATPYDDKVMAQYRQFVDARGGEVPAEQDPDELASDGD